LEKSPALLIFAAISLEIACYGFVKNPVILVLIPLITVSAACFMFRTEAKNTLFMMFMIVTLTTFCSIRIALVLDKAPPETAKAEFSGIITMNSIFGRGQALIVQSNEGVFLIKRPIGESYKLGEILSLRGWIKPFSSASNEEKSSGFDEETFWKSRGATAELVATNIKREEPGVLNLHSLRQLIHDKFKTMPESLSGYLDAMWTGFRDKELESHHQRWGTAHLLAVSGFHVGLVTAATGLIFSFLRNHARVYGFILSFFMWIYVIVSGAAPSAIRAACMFQVAVLSGALGRRVHAVNSVAVAGSLLLLYSPFLFWNIGWRLSVIAAFTITALSEIILNENLRKWTWAMIPSAVYLTTYPVVASVFGSIPAVGIIINIVAVPFFAFAFPFISFAAFFSVLRNITEASLRLYGNISDFLAWIIPWYIPYNSFLSMFCVLFFYGLILSTLKNRGVIRNLDV
jgi:competence protein ComEC